MTNDCCYLRYQSSEMSSNIIMSNIKDFYKNKNKNKKYIKFRKYIKFDLSNKK